MEIYNQNEYNTDDEEVYEIFYFKTSAKTGKNVNTSASGLTQHIIHEK